VTPDVDLVQRVFLAFERRDLGEFESLFHEDGVFEAITAQIEAGGRPYVGHEGLRRYLEDVGRLWEELQVRPTRFHDDGAGLVTATGRVYAWAVGRAVDSPASWLFRVRDGRIAYARVFDTASGAQRAVAAA
jgi:ketosteroid isomerase-like protein